jgi:pSer/pThr/pTyr-binding forkhead associated (FHA) protein
LLRREGIRLAVNDLGSANGTYVNGQLHLIISFGAAELE